MKTSILTVAAALSVAVVASAGAAEAGGCGGKGGWRSAHSYSPSYGRMSYSPSYAHQKAAAEARREAIAAAKRREALARAAAEKREAIAEAKEEAAEHRRTTARLAEKQRVAKLAVETTEGDNAIAEKKDAKKPVTTAALDVPPPAAKPATIATTTDAKASEPVKSVAAQKRDVACKRFVPAAGLTITVACGN